MAMVQENTYKAVMCARLSTTAREGIEATVIQELPRKITLGKDQVRITVRAASINFPELLMMQGKYQFKPSLPFTLCTEGAGVVSEVGPRVQYLRPGDRVLFSWMGGCACEELVVPESVCSTLPASLSFSQGAGFLMVYETAYHALVHRGRLEAGEWLLVTGAAGGVGSAAIQVGKALGARVIAAASSDEKLEFCKKLGADHVVNYSNGNLKSLKDVVGKITGGAFCDVIFEPVGGDVFDQCVRCVATKGNARLLVVGFAGGRIPQLPVNNVLIRRFDLIGVQVYGQLLSHQPALRQEMLTQLLQMSSAGKLVPHVCAEFPMEQHKDAFALMEEKKVLGKCCITFGAASKL